MSAVPKAPLLDELRIERLTEADLDDVLEIERLCFPVPWSRQVFVEELNRGWAHLDVLRAPETGRVIAFCNYWLVADELQVLNVATHPQARRRGAASKLLTHMLAVGRTQGCTLATLEVRRSNLTAQCIYQRFGFHPIGVRTGYYGDNGEDAVVMRLDLP